MHRYAIPVAALMITGFAAIAPASADAISTVGAAPVLIDTANGTPPSSISLGASAENVGIGGQFTQEIVFTSGYDSVAGPVDFSVTELIDSVSVTISGVMYVSNTADPDTITLTGGTTFDIGDLKLTSEALTFFDSAPFPGGVGGETLTFDATFVPEPASLAILAGGLLGIGIIRRRRLSQI